MIGKKTFLGMPTYGTQTFGAGRSLWRARRDMDSVCVSGGCGSLLAANFNGLWCAAMNLAHKGDPPDYFAMLHDDIRLPDFWLDDLIQEMEAKQLDVLGVVAPIKDERGLTSIAMHEEGNNWRAVRLTMAEVFRLPETFTSKDVGRKLLLNTGCWVCKFDMAWATRVHFEINDRIVFNTALDCYHIENESEDWFFSRRLHQLGLKIGATRKIPLFHQGRAECANQQPWGNQTFDEAITDRSLLPEFDADGFRLPHDVIGWATPEECKALWRLANQRRVLEVGAYCGLSTICMAQSAESVVSVDPHDGRGTPAPRETFTEFQRNVARYGMTDRVSAFIGTLEDFPGGEFDLIFIDGRHDLDSVRDDIRLAIPMLAEGGLIAVHDYQQSAHPDVTVAVDELLAAGGELILVQDTLAVVRPPAAIPLEV